MQGVANSKFQISFFFIFNQFQSKLKIILLCDAEGVECGDVIISVNPYPMFEADLHRFDWRERAQSSSNSTRLEDTFNLVSMFLISVSNSLKRCRSLFEVQWKAEGIPWLVVPSLVIPFTLPNPQANWTICFCTCFGSRVTLEGVYSLARLLNPHT